MVNVQKPRARGSPACSPGTRCPGRALASPGQRGVEKRVSTAGTEPPQQTHSRNECSPVNHSFREKQVKPLVSRQVRRGDHSGNSHGSGNAELRREGCKCISGDCT